jgi:hypothetical protein
MHDASRLSHESHHLSRYTVHFDTAGVSMSCEEKVRLAKAYEAATAKFAEAVRQLHGNIGTSTRAEYERLRHVSDEARVQSEHARLALEEHIAMHKC